MMAVLSSAPRLGLMQAQAQVHSISLASGEHLSNLLHVSGLTNVAGAGTRAEDGVGDRSTWPAGEAHLPAARQPAGSYILVSGALHCHPPLLHPACNPASDGFPACSCMPPSWGLCPTMHIITPPCSAALKLLPWGPSPLCVCVGRPSTCWLHAFILVCLCRAAVQLLTGSLWQTCLSMLGCAGLPPSHVLPLWLQVTVGALLTRWGDAGFEAHVKRMQQSYAHRASTLHAAAGKQFRHCCCCDACLPPTSACSHFARVTAEEPAC